jgi:hypothetical protein
MGAKITTNEITNVEDRDLVVNNCFLGTQDKTGNKFDNNSEGTLVNSIAFDNLFLYVNTPGTHWRPTTISGVPNGQTWFQEVPNGNNQTCLSSGGLTNNPSIALLTNAVNGAVLNNHYYSHNKWTSQWYVMHQLINNPTLRTANTSLANFYNGSHALKQYYSMASNIDNLHHFTASELNDYNNYSTSLLVKLNEIELLYETLNDQNYQQYQAILDNKHAEIMTLIESCNNIVNISDQRAIMNANSYKVSAAALPQLDYFCDEYRLLFDLQLDRALYGANHLLQQRASDLSYLASKCHLDFGLPALQAQSICEELNIPYTTSSCSYAEPRQDEETRIALNEIKVYPIPSSNMINIESKSIITSFEILDMSGKYIMSIAELNSKMIDIDISKLYNGLYLLTLIDKDGYKYVKRIIKI